MIVKCPNDNEQLLPRKEDKSFICQCPTCGFICDSDNCIICPHECITNLDKVREMTVVDVAHARTKEFREIGRFGWNNDAGTFVVPGFGIYSQQACDSTYAAAIAAEIVWLDSPAEVNPA